MSMHIYYPKTRWHRYIWHAFFRSCYFFRPAWSLLSTIVAYFGSDTLIYDQQSLIEIRNSVFDLDYAVSDAALDDYRLYLPLFLSDIPDYLCRQPFVVSRRKRSRCHGKRGGRAVRFRTTLEYRGDRRVWHIQEVTFHWIRPIVPETIHRPLQFSCYRTRRDGVNAQLLPQGVVRAGLEDKVQKVS